MWRIHVRSWKRSLNFFKPVSDVALDNGDNFVYFLSEEVEVPAPTPTSGWAQVRRARVGPEICQVPVERLHGASILIFARVRRINPS